MILSCYIVDDERHAIEVLRDYILKTPGLSLFGSSTDPLEALAAISVPEPPDLTFVDVDMPQLNGLDFAGMVNGRTTVIFTTAYREYAVEAFERRAADYLVKPLFYERFLAAVQRFRDSGIKKEAVDFFVSTGTKGQLVRVPISDIRYIQGADAYIKIYLDKASIMTYMRLAEVIKYLPASGFTRIHKSYIVNDGLVRVIEPGQVRLKDDTRLPLGPSYRNAFQRKMNTPG
jgi:DNA-binding LytR/AlgR family response regulator